MIPKRQNHTLPDLMAAAPMRTYGRVFCRLLVCDWTCYQMCKFAFRLCYDKNGEEMG